MGKGNKLNLMPLVISLSLVPNSNRNLNQYWWRLVTWVNDAHCRSFSATALEGVERGELREQAIGLYPCSPHSPAPIPLG
ncbi:hypothetical protein FHR98_002737 [Limibacillus halophilus]|uniref:Uncharacterized protein n=1 Tax=Limibacillus halophilus TaxID=1579333 RepID=A0A839SUH0_9PROT|nr:hypothetical protein [Limibacillus halophilus]